MKSFRDLSSIKPKRRQTLYFYSKLNQPKPVSSSAEITGNSNPCNTTDVPCCREQLGQKKVTYELIRDAYHKISILKDPTPLNEAECLEPLIGDGNVVFLKEEHKHVTGSYKERGATNKLLRLTDDEKKRGVITNSAGNHGQAVAYMAKKLGIKATVVMPELTPNVKVRGVEGWGAEVVLKGAGFDEAFQEACRLCKLRSYTFVHAFDDPDVIAGQGTCGLEILQKNPYIDTVIVPIGGGGLIAGVSLAMKTVNPKIKIYGVETESMPKMSTSLKNKGPTVIPFVPSIADGIAVKKAGSLTYEIVKDYVDDIVTVNEDDIAFALLTLLEKEKTMCEGAGAASIAALLSRKLKFQNKSIACIISGGNIDVSLLRNIIERGLVHDGRMLRIRFEIRDVPGQLAMILQRLADLGCNVADVSHDRAFHNIPVGYTAAFITVQTRGKDHISDIKKELEALQVARPFIRTFEFIM